MRVRRLGELRAAGDERWFRPALDRLAGRSDDGAPARFLAAARSPLSVSATIVKVGGHRTSIYSPYVRPALQWLASTLPGFRP